MNKDKLVKGFILTTMVGPYVIVSLISTLYVITFFGMSNPRWLAMECYNNGMNMHRTATQLNMTNVTLWRRAKRIGIAWLELKNTSSKKYLYKKYWMDYTPIIKHLNLKID